MVDVALLGVCGRHRHQTGVLCSRARRFYCEAILAARRKGCSLLIDARKTLRRGSIHGSPGPVDDH